MAFYLRPFNEWQKGLACIIGGILILLYALGFFKEFLNLIVVIGAVGLIIYGFVRMGGMKKIKELTEKKKD